ncbi:hypothetical protein SDRG_01459 [Saprolegnia diclina VS20]|uniref:PQ-loop repeat-containing protein 1 n=1 Tax=Saprolegnia diclina (strain VS20) TaxID=1156394 RepID=T0SF41_SAPDV|nr:hypothetical protein SDRG_01459 [Saprolegnia diclina VS20]EQC41492.1 hypothetical protein SDRG_01459 [Saprolegnia diclina VS20]|eukprot:XP_008605206.1 hypothetical protein SDRG_01459 [Saprolegnia diclina VS20]
MNSKANTTAMETVADIGIVGGGVLPYVPQYIYMARYSDTSGFSSMVCLILLAANMTRVCFYVRSPFEATLLVQSVVMMAAQLLMLELVVRKGRRPTTDPPLRLVHWSRHAFWKWSYFSDYLGALSLLTCLAYVLFVSLFPSSDEYTQLVGIVALGTEACLGLPQVHKNHKRRSTDGVSYTMVVGWAFGDVFKTMYALHTSSPLQFVLCGATQTLVDGVLVLQILCFARHARFRLNDVAYAPIKGLAKEETLQDKGTESSSTGRRQSTTITPL